MEKYFDINEQGFSIRCKLYAKDMKQIRRIILYCHGFGGSKDTHSAARFAEQATSKYKDLGVVTFDWPCHGKDARSRLVLTDCDAYLSLMVSYIQKTWTKDEICCYGTSFGGYLTLKYLSEHGNPFRKVALRSPAVDMYAVLLCIMDDDDLRALEKGRDAELGFDRKIRINQAYVDEVHHASITERDFIPFADDLLIFHGTNDEIVSFSATRQFADDNVIEFIPVDGIGHRFRNPQILDRVHQDMLAFFYV